MSYSLISGTPFEGGRFGEMILQRDREMQLMYTKSPMARQSPLKTAYFYSYLTKSVYLSGTRSGLIGDYFLDGLDDAVIAGAPAQMA